MIWRKLIFFCMCLLLYVNMCRAEDHVEDPDQDLQKFLHNRLEYTNNQLTSLLDQSSYTKDVQTDVEFYTARTDILQHPYINANIFSLFNDTYVFMGNTLFYVIPSNETLAFNEHKGLTKIEKNASLIKAIEYNNRGFIFIANPSGYSHIYEYSDEQWIFVQSIHNTDQASDAKFFVNENNLYLIISNIAGNGLAPTSIYKWTETHFDEIEVVLTNDVITVVSFNNEKSEIVLVVQNSPNHQKHNLIAYEFHDDRLTKKQLLLANNTHHVISYQYKDQHYLVIFEETENSTLYWWDGFEFVSWMKFENYTGIQSTFLATISEIPIIFLIQKDRLFVFGHSSNFLRLISKTKIREHYEKILDMQLISHNDTKMMLIFMLTSESQLKSVIIPFSMDVHEIEIQPPGPNDLLECLANLEKSIKINNHTLDSLTKSSSKMILTNEPLEYKGRINVGAAVRADSASVNSQFTSTRFHHQANELKSRIDSVIDRINILQPKIDTLFHEGKMMHGSIEIRGGLHAEQIWAKNLNVEYLNGGKWTPNMWLSYTKPQTITGPVLCKELHTTNLEVSHLNTDINELFEGGLQNIDNLPRINSLTANSIQVDKINGIPFEDVYLRSKPTVMQDVKKFHDLSIGKMQAEYLNNKPFAEATEQLQDITEGRLLFSPNLHIRNLNFEKINDVQWNIFKDSLFRIGVTNRITGSLTGVTMKADQLFAKQISSIDTDALLTTTTDQVVISTLQFSNIHAQNVVSNKINNINPEKQAATSQNNIVKGPVSLQNMQVNGNLHINTSSFPIKTGEEHVIGTNESDLLQIYNSKVKIIGNLRLSNIQVSDMAKVIVNNVEFNQNLNTSYWLKSQNQVIPTHFDAQKGITTPHLTTSLLNNFPVSSYMVNTLEDKPPTSLLFENVTILGNVIIDPKLIHIPDLNRIDLEAVKITGSYKINGRTSLQGKITIRNLITNYLDEIQVSNAINSRYSGQVLGKKFFENVIVADIISNTVLTRILNNVDLEILKEAALYLDKPEDLEILRFGDVTAQNIVASNINNNEVLKHVSQMDNAFTMTSLNNLKVNSNVQIKNAQEVTYINNRHINDLLSNVLRNDGDLVLQNNVKFLGNVFAENVEVKYVNNVNFPNLVERLLYRTWNQNITADYTFDQLNAPNIFVPQINNILTEKLINTKNPNPQDLVVWGGLQIFSPTFLRSVNSESCICNLNDAAVILKNPPSRYWNVVHVSKNITAWDEYSDLNLILKKTVQSNGNNIINSPVIFQHHISAKTVYLQKLINGVDINEIFADAVLKNAAEQQIITAHKRFGRLAASSVLVEGNADIPLINEIIDVVELDQSILNIEDIHNRVIKGHKVFFSGLQANRLMTDKVSDMDPLDLINLSDVHDIPRTAFHSLQVGNNLEIDYVNGLNMREILKERLLRYHNEEQAAYGTYYFQETAYIMGDSNITKINDVPVDDIVLDVGIQSIPSPKSFVQDLSVKGSVEVDILNGRNLSECYEQAILLGTSNTIRGPIKFNNISTITGNITTKFINGLSMQYINEWMHSKGPVIQTEIITNITDKMVNIIKRSSEMSADMPDTYLYLEKSTDLQIPIPNAIDGFVDEHNETVLIYVTQAFKGSLCGLPDYCTCPAQETIQISRQLSINTIASSFVQRTFNYEHKKMVAHLFTNTISTSSACRANSSTTHNELTSMSLMVHYQNLTEPVFFGTDRYVGYISGVQFFTNNDQSYMVVSRYYNPIEDTHMLNCYLYKLIREMRDIILIQSIPCNGAWTLHVFPTAQGATLIIGSYFQFNEVIQDTGAEIYRFDPGTEKFMLLRKVRSSGCNTATGVVIGPDSLIVLGHKSSLEIFKYHPLYDNYYFYQTILLESPVVRTSVFYVGDFGLSDAHLCVVTKSGNFYIYSFQYIRGWQIISSGEIEGLQSLLPFKVNDNRYLFAISTKRSYVLSIIKQGSN